MAASDLVLYTLSAVIGVLLLVVAFLIWVIGRMSDKLMSRNFYDYTVTRSLADDKKEATIKKTTQAEVYDDQSLDDLGYLDGMG